MRVKLGKLPGVNFQRPEKPLTVFTDSAGKSLTHLFAAANLAACMSTLSSTSTRAEVLAAYADNASYEEDASVAKCKAFITAVRILLSPKHLVKRAAHGGRGGEEIELDLATLREELKTAQSWLAGAIAADSGAVIHADFSGFRE